MSNANVYCLEKYKRSRAKVLVSSQQMEDAPAKTDDVVEDEFLKPFNGMKISDAIAIGILPPIPRVDINKTLEEYQRKGIEFYPINLVTKGEHLQFIRDRTYWCVREELIYNGRAEYTLYQDGFFYGTVDAASSRILAEFPYFLTWHFTDNKWELKPGAHLCRDDYYLDFTYEEIMEE